MADSNNPIGPVVKSRVCDIRNTSDGFGCRVLREGQRNRREVEPYRGFTRCILAIFQKYAICSILANPFKPHPLKNAPNHNMIPLH